MDLDVLPVRVGGAARKHGDRIFLLLQRYPDQGRARFRHYRLEGSRLHIRLQPENCRGPASLKGAISYPLPPAYRRRHRSTTRRIGTYALAAPRGSALAEMRALDSYGAVHEAMAKALRHQGIPAELNQTAASGVGPGPLFREKRASRPSSTLPPARSLPAPRRKRNKSRPALPGLALAPGRGR